MPIARKTFPACPIERSVAVLSGRWKAMIVWQLLDSPKKYGELNQNIAEVSQRVLTQALRELEEDGVVKKDHVAWTLTPLGEGLKSVMHVMWDWGSSHALAVPNR